MNESNSYIIGPGDHINGNPDIPEYSGRFTVGPDGNLYLPRLRSRFVSGLTVDELAELLEVEYSKYVKSPEVYVNPVIYRPIKVYIGGEIRRPGFYRLSAYQNTNQPDPTIDSNSLAPESAFLNIIDDKPRIGGLSQSILKFPTLFDALRVAGGITPYSDLSKITVTRIQSVTKEKRKKKALINLLPLLNNGDDKTNIVLYDGDSIFVNKSSAELVDQVAKASQTNLSPDYLQVYVYGRVRDPGIKVLPQGASQVKQ